MQPVASSVSGMRTGSAGVRRNTFLQVRGRFRREEPAANTHEFVLVGVNAGVRTPRPRYRKQMVVHKVNEHPQCQECESLMFWKSITAESDDAVEVTHLWQCDRGHTISYADAEEQGFSSPPKPGEVRKQTGP